MYKLLGDKVVGDVVAGDIKNLLNHWMNEGLAFSTVKKVYVLLNEYFRRMYLEEMISKNPMDNVEMIKKANFLSAQGKELLPECEMITVLDPNELKKFKEVAYATYSNRERKHKQTAAYILMLNTGMRPGEALALRNCDIDLESRQLHIQKSVKEIYKREGNKSIGGRISKVS